MTAIDPKQTLNRIKKPLRRVVCEVLKRMTASSTQTGHLKGKKRPEK